MKTSLDLHSRLLCSCLVGFVVLTSATASAQVPDVRSDTAPNTSTAATSIPLPEATEVLGAENAAVSAPPASVALEQPIDPDAYICGPGDTFDLNFWGKQNFRLRIAADLEGRTFISKIGFVQVAGKTLTAVRTAIKNKVRYNYPGLNFDLVLLNPRGFLVHVVSNVKSPGTYISHPLERVSSLIARAGGATGSRRQISIRHRTGAVMTADLLLFERTGDTKYNPYVLDGDVVDVPFSGMTVSISGPLHSPGTYELVKSKDLAELLDLAGGFTSSVTRTLPIRLIRRNQHEQAVFRDLPFSAGSSPNLLLADGDSILVRSTDELQRSVLLIGAVTGADPLDTAATSKRLPFIEGDTVRSLIDRAGGIRAAGDLRRSYVSRSGTDSSKESVLMPIDLDALLVRRDFSADRPIAMGDTIVIPPVRYSVLVEGAVARPGLYNYNPMFGVAEYVAHAGGRSRTARELKDAKLIDPDGRTRDFQKNMKLSPGDAILIPERNFSRSEVVQLVFAGAGLVLSGVAITLAATR